MKIVFNEVFFFLGNGGDIQWCFSQVKGTIEEDVTEGKIYRIKLTRQKGLMLGLFTCNWKPDIL